MRTCPFCNADIDDNARFCLYCMTPLVEKEEIHTQQKRLRRLPILIIVIAGFLLTVGVGVFMLYRGSRDSQGNSLQVPFQTRSTLETTPSGTDALTEEQGIPEQTEPKETTKPGSFFDWLFSGPVTSDNPAKDTTTVSPTTPTTQKPTTTPTTAPTTAPTTVPTTAPTTAPTTQPTTEATTEPDWRDYGNGIPGTEGYRTQFAIGTYPEMYEEMCILPLGENPDVWCHLATPEEMNNPDYVNPGNEYITSYPANYSQNGICYIPAYNGNNVKVVAIGPSLGEMVSVFLPETIVYIGKKAFSCNYKTELAYVHIASDTVDIHPEAFPVWNTYTVVMRTSARCRNSNGEYYKDIAGRYGCVWEEWNG